MKFEELISSYFFQIQFGCQQDLCNEQEQEK